MRWGKDGKDGRITTGGLESAENWVYGELVGGLATGPNSVDGWKGECLEKWAR